MIVLGITGFEKSIPFKKSHWPGLEEREYRMSQGHDSSSVCVVDGQVVAAAAEERFSRKKHTGDFPAGAIRYCLATAGIGPSDIDEIAHGFDYTPYQEVFSLDPISSEQYQQVFSREALLAQLNRVLPDFPAAQFPPGQSPLGPCSECLFHFRLGRMPGCCDGRYGRSAKRDAVSCPRQSTR